jgi:hypothetical protein
MKRMMMIVAISVMLVGAGAWAAGAFPKHPNLGAAHKHLQEATEKITAAQKANEFDMEGHAAKAKDLIAQAQGELEEAAKAANANKK